MSKELYEMELHEIKEDLVNIMRVCGGWIYTMSPNAERENSVFVPLDNEFMIKHEADDIQKKYEAFVERKQGSKVSE